MLPPARAGAPRGQPLALDLPALTLDIVGDWLVRPDVERRVVGGLRLALDWQSLPLLGRWLVQMDELEQMQVRATPLREAADALPEPLGTLHVAFRRMTAVWVAEAKQLAQGDEHDRETARQIEARLQLPLGDALQTPRLLREVTRFEGVSPENSPENSRGGEAGKRPPRGRSQPEWWESSTNPCERSVTMPTCARLSSPWRPASWPGHAAQGLPIGAQCEQVEPELCSAPTRGDGTCLPRAPVSATSERCEGNTSFTCVLTSKAEGRQSSVRETHLDQLRNRATGTTTPRSRLAGSALQYAPA